MKTSVLDFIDSNTLRRHLSDQKLEPAIECILIANCRSRSLEEKLEALQERYDAYSDEDFKRGIYNFRGGDFRNALREYTEYKRSVLTEIHNADRNCVYAISAEYAYVDGQLRSTLDAAVREAKDTLDDDESCLITKRRIDEGIGNSIQIRLNENKEIYDVSVMWYDDTDWDIADSYADLPHLYKPGDIVRYCDSYSVVAEVTRFEKLPPYMVHSDYTDMCLFCLGYGKDSLHSCGGSFGHEHIPILGAEICNEEDVPDYYRPLIAVSRFYRGEIRFIDFIEMYSNRAIDKLIR